MHRRARAGGTSELHVDFICVWHARGRLRLFQVHTGAEDASKFNVEVAGSQTGLAGHPAPKRCAEVIADPGKRSEYGRLNSGRSDALYPSRPIYS